MVGGGVGCGGADVREGKVEMGEGREKREKVECRKDNTGDCQRQWTPMKVLTPYVIVLDRRR